MKGDDVYDESVDVMGCQTSEEVVYVTNVLGSPSGAIFSFAANSSHIAKKPLLSLPRIFR